MLPKRKPFKCPICGKSSKSKISLARHYAFLHKKIFEMTDLTHEALYGSKSSIRKFDQKRTESEEKKIQQQHSESAGVTRAGYFGPGDQGKMKVEQEEVKILENEVVPNIIEGPSKAPAEEFEDENDDFGDLSAPKWSY